jgi:HAD superfamily hydrolase (TIGR01509 family)
VGLKALLWDVDGTLAETERDGHRPAFNHAFAAAGVPVHWDEQGYAHWLSISGGRERMAAQLTELEGQPPPLARLEALQAAKQRQYRALVEGGSLQLRPGVACLIAAAQAAGLEQVVVTTSGRAAVAVLLERLLGPLAQAFAFWICGEDVAHKKPHPEAYRLACERLGHAPRTLLAIEDSANGLAAACGAGLPCLLTLSHYSRLEPPASRQGARAVVSQLGPGAAVLHGPACHGHQITLSYLQALLHTPAP